VYNQIDSGVKEKKGKKEELRILETHNSFRVKKHVSYLIYISFIKIFIAFADKKIFRDGLF
jgi:hypothetical protein